MTKKVKKIKNENSYPSAYPYRPTYPICLKHVNPRCRTQTYFHTVESVLVTNM